MDDKRSPLTHNRKPKNACSEMTRANESCKTQQKKFSFGPKLQLMSVIKRRYGSKLRSAIQTAPLLTCDRRKKTATFTPNLARNS